MSLAVETSLPFSSAMISPFLILLAVELAVAGGEGDKAGGNLVGRLHHVDGVGVLGGVRVEVQHSGDALGNGAGGQHDHRAVRQLLGLLGGHNDVFVVGQHKHRLGGHALHGGQDIGSWRGSSSARRTPRRQRQGR